MLQHQQQQQQFSFNQTSSSSLEKGNTLMISPTLDNQQSSHNIYNDYLLSKDIRFEAILEAPTAAGQKLDESPLTYLNKGQAYNILLRDSQQYTGTITSTIMIMFHDESHRQVAPNYWKFWKSQQTNPQYARAIDIELSRSNGVFHVECQYFDRITFKWNGNKGANIMVRFNCLSTDFSRIKGVKGIPLRLHMESQVNDLNEKTYCRIKLFRDKGAERKNKDDAKHIERQLEKFRGKNGEPHPLWLTCTQTTPFTLFQNIDTKDTTKSIHSPSSPRPPPTSIITTATISSSSSPSPSSSLVLQHSFSTNTKRHHRYLTDPGYSLNITSISPPSSTFYSQPTFHPFMTASSSSPPLHSSAWLNNNNNNSSENHVPTTINTLDIDPNYIPQKRIRVAKRSLFVKFESQSIYRAIYLEELTVQHLKDKLLSKMNISEKDKLLVKNMIRQVFVKSDVLVTIDDDVMVQDIPEEQDMHVNRKINQDGSSTLMLIY
ncbi:unnamed protein product [Cunninghamella echinulata]